MCRLLAVRCRQPVPVCRFLIGGDNSFAVQSLEHPDGWGIAYYVHRAPHLIKSVLPAICDGQFERVSLSVESDLLVAHIRRATTGAVAARNCHPFQFGPWIFAHNGFVRNFDGLRDELHAKIDPKLRRFLIGETDSEAFFFLFLSYLSEVSDLFDPEVPERALAGAMARTVADISEIADSGPELKPHLSPKSWYSTVVSNGSTMFGVRLGKPLAFQETSTEDGAPLILLSSEFIGRRNDGEDAWAELREAGYVFVDAELRAHQGGL